MQENDVTNTLRRCADDSFPVCPRDAVLTAATAVTEPVASSDTGCACTDRRSITIGGVSHGISTDPFWDPVYAAAKQAARDAGVVLDFERFEPQESAEVLHNKMAARIASLCQNRAVDGVFVTLSSETVVDAVRRCVELDVPVMSINAGHEASRELGLLHHVGMLEENVGRKAGLKMADMASFDRAFCLNHNHGVAVVTDRCRGFRRAMEELGIDFGLEIIVPNDNMSRTKVIVEEAVGDPDGDWSGTAFLLTGTSLHVPGLELKRTHPGLPWRRLTRATRSTRPSTTGTRSSGSTSSRTCRGTRRYRSSPTQPPPSRRF